MEIAGIAHVQIRADLPQFARDLEVARTMLGRFEAGSRSTYGAASAAATGFGTAATGAAARATQANNQIAHSTQAVATGYSNMFAMARRYLGFIGLGLGVQQFVHLTNTFSDLTGRMENMVGAAGDAGDVMERLYQIARVTYSSFQSTAEVFLLNRQTLEGLGYTINQTLDFTEAMNNALVVSGAKADVAASVMRQLSQAMTIGRLSGQNLNSVLENGGRIVKLLADELGVTTVQVKRMGMEGKISSDLIFRAAINNMELLREEANNLDVTIGDSLQLMGNALLRFAGNANEATGVAQLISGAIVALSDNLDVLAGALAAVALYFPLKWLIGGVVAFVNFYNAMRASVIGMAAVQTALGLTTTGLRTMTVAATFAKAAFAWIAPIGFVIAAVVGALYTLSSRTNAATVSLERHEAMLTDVKNAYRDATQGVQDWQAAIENTRPGEAMSNLLDRRSDLIRALADIERAWRIMDITAGPFNEATALTGEFGDQLEELLDTFKNAGPTTPQVLESFVSGLDKLILDLAGTTDVTAIEVAKMAQEFYDLATAAESPMTELGNAAFVLNAFRDGLSDSGKALLDSIVGLVGFGNAVDDVVANLSPFEQMVNAMRELAAAQEALSTIESAPTGLDVALAELTAAENRLMVLNLRLQMVPELTVDTTALPTAVGTALNQIQGAVASYLNVGSGSVSRAGMGFSLTMFQVSDLLQQIDDPVVRQQVSSWLDSVRVLYEQLVAEAPRTTGPRGTSTGDTVPIWEDITAAMERQRVAQAALNVEIEATFALRSSDTAATDAVTAAQQALADATATAMADLEKSDNVLRDLVPSLAAAAEATGKMEALTEAHGTAVAKWQLLLRTVGVSVLPQVLENVGRLNGELETGIGELNGMTEVLTDLQNEFNALQTEQAVRDMTDLDAALAEVNARFDAYGETIAKTLADPTITTKQAAIAEGLREQNEKLRTTELAWVKTADATNTYHEAITRLRGIAPPVLSEAEVAAQQLGIALANATTDVDRLIAHWEFLRATVRSGLGAQEVLTEFTAGLQEQIRIAGLGDREQFIANTVAGIKDAEGATTEYIAEQERLAGVLYDIQQASQAASAGAGEAADAFKSATEAIEDQIKTLEFEASLIGLTADEVARLRMEEELLQAQETLMEAAGPIVSEGELASITDLVARLRLAKEATLELQEQAAQPKVWETVKEYAESFTQSLVSGLLAGKSVMESLQSALSSLASSLAQAAIKDLFAGNFLMAGVKGLFALISGIIARRMQEKRDLEDAQKAWADMADELHEFALTLKGRGGGDLTTSLRDATDEAQKFADAAIKAKQPIAEINAMLAEFAARRLSQFIGDFGLMMDAMSEGLGGNSPAISAAENVLSVGQALRDFVEDTRLAVSILGETNAPVEAAQVAARAYALSLLDTAPVLSEVETRLRELQGTSAHLQSLLEDLGMSAEDAGAAVQSGLIAAFDQLRADFQADISTRLNDALGKGYLNDVHALINEGSSLLNDALILGLDTTDIGRYFVAAAQNIVDSAGLTGEAFDDLIELFPELAGVVHEAADSVEEAMDRINQTGKSILEWVNEQVSGPGSTSSPIDRLIAAQTTYNAQLALAQQGNMEAQEGITGFADDLMKAAQDMFASSPQYQAIREQILRDLTNLPAAQLADDPVVVALRESVTAILDGLYGIETAILSLPTTLLEGFSAIDLNVDGMLSLAELENVMGDHASAVILALDENGDGLISRIELLRAAVNNNPAMAAQALQSSFSMLDTNGDALLSATELAALGTAQQIAALIHHVDTNGDGMISAQELVAAAARDTTDAVDDVEQNTQAALNLLEAVRALGGVQQATSNTISEAIIALGTVTENINIALADGYFSPMVQYLAAIALNTSLDDTTPEVRHTFFERLFGRMFGDAWGRGATGGVVPMFAHGGVVGNGNWGIDSVIARYAGGGAIGLAGGEGILTAAATRALGGVPAIEAMNRAGRMPGSAATGDTVPYLIEMIRAINTGTETNRTGLGALVVRMERLERRERVEASREPRRQRWNQGT